MRRKKLEQKPNLDRMSEYAWALNKYGASLFYAGRYEAAREASHSALLITRKLVSQDRPRYEVDYANHLYNYVVDLQRSGKDEDAEEARIFAREALDIHERLAKKNWGRFASEYASALDQYGNSLSLVGRNKEALDYAKQATEIYQTLVHTNPGRFESYYAESLNNYAHHLSEAGEQEAAITHLREALEIRDRLRQKNPDRFEPSYVTSLTNYVAALGRVGRANDAIGYVLEAYMILKRLTQKQPQRFGASFLHSFYSYRFLSWLYQKEFNKDTQPQETILPLIPMDEQTVISVHGAFVGGCITTDLELRASEFRSVLSNWTALSKQQKKHSEEWRFCAAAWCAKFDGLLETSWQADWHKYCSNLNANIPSWMDEVGERLDFHFPT
jgi:tetratricopeptide (TPR) repeat protein